MIRFVLVFLVFVSCSDGIARIEEPDYLIPKKEMIVVLKEMAKLEAHVQSNYLTVDRYNLMMQKSGDSLLKELNVKKEDYESALAYYGSRQEVIMEMYSEVLDQLAEELGELEVK
jgi:chaperonin cofactor prefoldin